MTISILARLRSAFDFAREDLRRFEVAERRAVDRLATAHVSGLAATSPGWVEELEDNVADAGDEVASAKVRLERARMSLAYAEARATERAFA